MDKIKMSRFKRFVAKHILKYYIFWLRNFNRGKLKHNLLTRKDRGYPECTDCGLCCVNCECWDSKTKKCKIWKHTLTTNCRDWPITPLQLKLDNLEKKCRFYWEKEK